MTTEPIMGDCHCNFPDILKTAGPVASTCHHTPNQTLVQMHQELSELIDLLELNKMFDDITNKPLATMAEEYKTQFVERADLVLLHPFEHQIMLSGFLRFVTISIECLQIRAQLKIQEMATQNPELLPKPEDYDEERQE